MSNIKTKELIICLIAIIALVLTITTNVFAQDINALLNEANNNEFEQIIDNNTTPNNVAKNNTNTSTATVNNTNNTNNTTKTIPYTGIDYSVVLIIAICGISAVYAYKKIRDYNV